MSTAALVPVKRLAAGKSRLADALGREATSRLVLAMLGDVVEALRAVAALARVVVASPDPAVGEAARAAGAEAWVRDDLGLNPCLEQAGAELAAAGTDRLLVVLGDVAGVLPQDVAALIDALDGLGGRGVVLSPARDGGTTALLRSPPDAIPCRFGKESAAAHHALARRAGLPYAELPLASLAVDLDRIGDARALLRAPGALRTRALLGELGVGEAP